MPVFDILDFLPDPQPRPAAVNMAMDEVILKEVSVPTLRTYCWLRPAVSFGCFEKYSAVEERYAGREFVRRWTGGGVVLHGEDLTYSLAVPGSHPLARATPAQSYLSIHEALAQALREAGIPAALTGSGASKISNACFENAVCHDVMLGDRKIAGAAQRRTRYGLLHQGSIQGAGLPGDYAEKFAAVLAGRVNRIKPDAGILPAALALAESKYAARKWMEKFQ